MKMQRVVVTGLGSISALGHNNDLFWDALSKGQSGIGTITQVDCSLLRFTQGAEVKNYNSLCYFGLKQASYLDRFAQFALIAAREAVIDAGFTKDDIANDQTGVMTGSAMGGKITEDQGFYRLYHKGAHRASPTIIPNAMANAGVSQIAAEFGITGPSYNFSTACSSSTHAIGHAFWLIRQGTVKRAITGGSEALFSLGQIKAWEGMRIIAPDTCRPFSKDRRGMILGEGGAMLVLESYASARARNAKIYAEIIGFGMSSDGKHLINPDTVGQQKAILAALKDADLPVEGVDYINTHGTGTFINDVVESQTIQTVFGLHLDNLLTSSTKSMHGHLLGATGALETIATVLALKYQMIPPTLNYIGKDPSCDIPLVIDQVRSFPMEHAICNSFAFGGLNAILVLKAAQPLSWPILAKQSPKYEGAREIVTRVLNQRLIKAS